MNTILKKRFHQIGIIITLTMLLITGCKEMSGPRGLSQKAEKGDAAPGKITDTKVKNIPGGAHIFYTLPKSEDLAYIKAVYTTRSSGRQAVKASRYVDSLSVNGFANNSSHKVELYSVSRGGTYSDSVTVTIHPLSPPFQRVYQSIKTQKAFGGLTIFYKNNITQDSLTIHVVKDSSGFILPVQSKYVHKKIDTLNVFDLQPELTKFGFMVSDQYGNRSDTLYRSIKPLFEVELNKQLWSNAKLPTDSWKHYKHYAFNQMWDNDAQTTDNSFEIGTAAADNFNSFPVWFTINLGQKAKLSRWIYYPQPHWAGQMPNGFILWGSADPKVDSDHPFNDSWTKLGKFTPKTPNVDFDPDTQYPANAEVFKIKNAINSPEVQYVRVEVLGSFNGQLFYNIGELSFYGQPENRDKNKNG
jgi:hypothetical protein